MTPDSLRLFLSYGHDENAPLVMRISKDLEAHGHQVWIDQTSMKLGEYWRRTILDGIRDSQGVVAFLSKHSIHDPGGCLDELRIAVSIPGVNIQTVLLEPEEEVTPPGLVAEIQWLDLSGWQVEKCKGEESFEAWYAAQFGRLCDALESPTTAQFVGEITELRDKLRPIILDQKERELSAAPYVGREWLREAVNSWRTQHPDSQVFVLLGTPGSGKSAFAVRMLWDDPYAICGLLVEWGKVVTNDPRQIIRTLAFKLAARLPDYRMLLLDAVRSLPSLDSADVSELFSWLVAQPLSYCSGTDRERVYIIVDALDEASDGRLAEMLADHLQDLPLWIGFVVTARPEQELVELFHDYSPVVINADNPDNVADIREYLHGLLPQASNQTIKEIADNAEGSFLYAKLIAESGMLQSSGNGLPRGLSAVYRQWFTRVFPDQESYKQTRECLELMVCEPSLPVEEFRRISAVDEYRYRDFRSAMGSLVRTTEPHRSVIPLTSPTGEDIEWEQKGQSRPEMLSFVHKSIADWLADLESSGRFFVDRQAGYMKLITRVTDQINRNQGWNNLEWDWQQERLARYYCDGQLWAEYERSLLGHVTFRRLWDQIDCFPANWDMSPIHAKLVQAWVSAFDRSCRHSFYELSDFAVITRVFEKAIRSPRLASVFFSELPRFEVQLGFLMRGVDIDAELPIGLGEHFREAITAHMCGTLQTCERYSVAIPNAVADIVASIVASRVRTEDTPKVPLPPGTPPELIALMRSRPEKIDSDPSAYVDPLKSLNRQLRESPHWFAYGDLDSTASVGADRAEAFDICAGVYELVYATTPDPERLSRLVHKMEASGKTKILDLALEHEPPLVYMGISHAEASLLGAKVARIVSASGARILRDDKVVQRWTECQSTMISEADVFMPLLSLSTLANSRMRDEIGHAITSGARVIPIVREEEKDGVFRFLHAQVEHSLTQLLSMKILVIDDNVTESSVLRETMGRLMSETQASRGQRLQEKFHSLLI